MPRGRIPEAWLPHVVALAATSSSRPQLRGIDVFSGSSRYYKQMLKEGMLCERMDVSIDKRHDVTKEAGVLVFIASALRCVRGESLVVMGPPCSFFVATTSKHHGRTVKKPMGNGSPFAKQGNRIATFISNAILLCAYLSINVFIEQPSTSKLWHIFRVSQSLASAMFRRVTWHMFVFGARTPKPQNGWVADEHFARRFSAIAISLYRKTKMPSARLFVRYDRTAKKKWRASRNMRGSQVYPLKFVRTLIALQFKQGDCEL